MKTDEVLDFLNECEVVAARSTTKTYRVWRWMEIYQTVKKLSEENHRYEKLTRWLIGEIIKGELDEEATLNKLVEYGFAEEKDGYISVRVEV